jgi:hypothetical protein
MLQLFFKRAVLFLHTTPEGVSKRYNAIQSGRGPVPVPDWVKDTLTYKHALAANDIIDLTPPGAKKKAMEKELKAAAPGKTEDEIAAEAKAEQPAVPLGVQVEGMPAPGAAGFQIGGGIKKAKATVK